MFLPAVTIDHIKEITGLSFDKASDFEALADMISAKTSNRLGVTTLKRLVGYISDDRATNKSTLNILAKFLGFTSWDRYWATVNLDSAWDDEDDALWIQELPIGTTIKVSYLNRTVVFETIMFDGKAALKVIEAINGSLQKDDIALICKIKRGERLEASKVYRGDYAGAYHTNGEVRDFFISFPKDS
ncbi:hypothetical protein [uncultured Duncaniella sp.]|jgi:hypothetical protein|uniref:hypothetical protein n=1 Tax=uncultured Duncaniella sp. TaxID=2768039 RepID=UPI0025B0989B|nr:hypothetical protein [uncultured Duncaniella sp.]